MPAKCTPILSSCLACGKQLLLVPSQIGIRKYCSNACAREKASPCLPAADRFWKHVNKTETCWVWTAGFFHNGYGAFHPKAGLTVRAHRYSYELQFGEIPNGMLVCHKCDNPKCVRPEHLFLGTVKDNSVDMVQKGRSLKGDKNYSRIYPERVPQGENNKNSKLTNAQVIEIRKRAEEGNSTVRHMATEYNVSIATIYHILNGLSWKKIV